MAFDPEVWVLLLEPFLLQDDLCGDATSDVSVGDQRLKQDPPLVEEHWSGSPGFEPRGGVFTAGYEQDEDEDEDEEEEPSSSSASSDTDSSESSTSTNSPLSLPGAFPRPWDSSGRGKAVAGLPASGKSNSTQKQATDKGTTRATEAQNRTNSKQRKNDQED